MVLSNEIFIWEVGDIGKANWRYTESTTGTAYNGTIEIQLTSCSGAAGLVGLINYKNKIYFVSKSMIANFSYTVKGCYYSENDGNYNKDNMIEHELNNGYLYEPQVDNGIINLADDQYSIPCVVYGNLALTYEDIFTWWYRRVKHGGISPDATAIGYETVAGRPDKNGDYQVADIVYKGGQGAFAAGVRSVASEAGSTAFGLDTEATGVGAIAAGHLARAEGDMSVSLGKDTVASGDQSFAAGLASVATGSHAFAEGAGTQALGSNSHAEGVNTIAAGANSHAEGNQTYAQGRNSHAQGGQTVAEGAYSMAGGIGSESLGHANFAFGDHIRTRGDFQAGLGRWNDPGEVHSTTGLPQWLFTIGDGSDEEHRHNAFGIIREGGFFYKGIDGEMHIFNENTLFEGSEDWWIKEVERINDNKYEITVTNGLQDYTTVWDVDWTNEDDVVWSSSTGQIIDMIGFDDTSDYHITSVEKINDSQYKMVAENANGGRIENIWNLKQEEDGTVTWINNQSSEKDPIEIDFINFSTLGDKATDLQNHNLKDYLGINLVSIDNSEETYKMVFTKTQIDLQHKKR